jgi:hypothetical protein
VNESTLRWKWQGGKDIPQVSQALGTLGITITYTKLTYIILIDLFTEPADIFKVSAHLQFA